MSHTMPGTGDGPRRQEFHNPPPNDLSIEIGSMIRDSARMQKHLMSELTERTSDQTMFLESILQQLKVQSQYLRDVADESAETTKVMRNLNAKADIVFWTAVVAGVIAVCASLVTAWFFFELYMELSGSLR